MPDPLHQINLTYDPGEDRLLLRIVTAGRAAYRLWLTRRVPRQIAAILDNVADKRATQAGATSSDAREAVRGFQREAAEEKVDRTTPFDDADTTLPLGKNPLLINRARAATGPDGARLILEAKDSPAITLGLESGLVHSLAGLLGSGAAQAEWNIHIGRAARPDSEEAPPEGSVH